MIIMAHKLKVSIQMTSHSSFLSFIINLLLRIWQAQLELNKQMGSWKHFLIPLGKHALIFYLHRCIAWKFLSNFCRIAPLSLWWKLLLRKEWWSLWFVTREVSVADMFLGKMMDFGAQLFFQPPLVQNKLLSLILNTILS